jgi:hypothetical protein
MKEYEKLGLSAMKKAYGTETMICDYYGGWVEGFLKAREMANGLVSYTNEINTEALENLGEKEIDPEVALRGWDI